MVKCGKHFGAQRGTRRGGDARVGHVEDRAQRLAGAAQRGHRAATGQAVADQAAVWTLTVADQAAVWAMDIADQAVGVITASDAAVVSLAVSDAP